jgi:hypothetical protein
MAMSLFDPSGAEILRQNREVLSSNITDLINEYGPKAFPDFDGKKSNILHFLTEDTNYSSSRLYQPHDSCPYTSCKS